MSKYVIIKSVVFFGCVVVVMFNVLVIIVSFVCGIKMFDDMINLIGDVLVVWYRDFFYVGYNLVG